MTRLALRQRPRRASALAALLALGLAGQAAARPTVFSTPSGNLRCTIVNPDARVVLVCQRLNDLRSIVLPESGRGLRAGRLGIVLPLRRTVAYGTHYSTDRFTCESHVLGLACENRDGHGFAISRQRLDLLSPGSDTSALDVAFPAPAQAPKPSPTVPPARVVGTPTPTPSCDSNYIRACVPVVSYDLDCVDIGYQTVQVVGRDHHRFDGDGDGFGCE